ncbi:MAG: aldo/keto reductase [Deltaproteobacteria bacterium]|nr:aldo/keto reductase [Deltaproteobacteria bacterium]
MKTIAMGSSGARVALIGQGTWNMEHDDPDTAVLALRTGLDLGATHIDTAEMYGAGKVERLVGRAITGRRADVYLVTKVLPSNASRAKTIDACERSLERLGTDYIDLYLLHWPGSHQFAETLAGFEQLVAAGKIRAYGVSNFDKQELTEAVELAGPGKIACNQVLYHLAEREIEAEIAPLADGLGVSIVAYSPFAQGAFPRRGTAGRRALDDVAKKHSATAHQVALAFLARTGRVFVIPKAATPDHVRDNAKASELALDAADLESIDRAFPLRRRGFLPTG